MDSKSKLILDKALSPQALRIRYGNVLAMEIWKLLQVVDLNVEECNFFFSVIDKLHTESQQQALIDKVWDVYYEKVANSILY